MDKVGLSEGSCRTGGHTDVAWEEGNENEMVANWKHFGDSRATKLA